MNDIDLEDFEVVDEEEEEEDDEIIERDVIMMTDVANQATNLTNNNNSNNNNNNNINNQSDNNNQSPQSIQSIATQAAAAMAAAMAAQQLLASAHALCGIDLASLSNFALMAGQQPPGLNGGHPTPEQLMAAAVATAAFLSPNHLVPQDLTVNQSGLGIGGVGGGGAASALAALSPLALAASTQTLYQNNNNNSTNNNQIQAGSQVNPQVLPNTADLLALELANHLRMQQQQQLQQKQQQPQHQLHLQQQQQPQQQQQHQQQQQQQQAQQQLPQASAQSQSKQLQQQQNHHHGHHHLLDGGHHNHSLIQSQQQQQQTNHHHRHHHLSLGGHHHHSSIQTQQQLLATKGFNPMAVVVGSGQQTEILTPTHLRKAKLMFFYVRYPNSSTLKECFRDVRFNKNNTAQLVKWFSNFREFYYIQMEKFARDAVADERIQCKEDIVVDMDHELINQLNNHYNKNRHIPLPEVFRQVVEETLRHFFDAIYHKKDQEQSWKKAIYKLIARLDQEVPEVFKTDAFNEHLE